MHSFIALIPEFFRSVWAYIVALFFFYRKDAAPDIEAGIVPLEVIQSSESANVVDDDGLAPAHGQSQAIECTEKDSDHTESVCSDNNSRPSRASAVDPVKSRIVDSTFNKVQDKTFNVVKSVVVTHNTVIVVPYSATIEYFEDPKDGAQPVPKKGRTTHATNRKFKFDEVPESPAHRYEEHGHKKRRDSIDSILDMFPAPPSYIPPLPPLPVATRELLDEVILKDTRLSLFSTFKRSSSTSSSESVTSSMFSRSACDTTQTSPPSTPNSGRSPFSPIESTFAEIDMHEDNTCSFPAVPDTPNPFSPVEPTFAEIDGHEDDVYGFPVAPKVEILLWPAESMCEGELRTLHEPAEVDPFSLSVEYALALQEHAAADEDTSSVASKHYAASALSSASQLDENEDLAQYICPEFFASASDYDALVKFHDRNVATYACASSANLGGQVPMGTPLQEQEFDRGSEDQPVRDMFDISPSEEAIVDSLLSQLETSFELDEKESSVRGSYGDWYAEQGFDREVGWGYYDFPPARALPPVAPLRIVKKNKSKRVRPIVVERQEDVPTQEVQGVVSGNWQENMANALKAFREAEAEDEDFRELFYRDSSCFSESSCVVKNTVRGKRYSDTSSDGFYDPERLKRLDESFESLERSMEQILTDLDQVYDGDATLKLEDASSVSRSGAEAVKDLGQEDTKDDASSVSEYSDVNDDSGVDGVAPCTWGFSDDDDDERETLSGGESDHWSDILELDDYSA